MELSKPTIFNYRQIEAAHRIWNQYWNNLSGDSDSNALGSIVKKWIEDRKALVGVAEDHS